MTNTNTTALADDQLLEFLGFTPADFTSPEHKARVLAAVSAKRATYERMAEVTVGLQLYEQGLSPKPTGVLVDWDKGRKHR